MTILNDRQIAALCADGMISPFEARQIRRSPAGPVLSYGPSSFGYDIRAAAQWRIVGPRLSEAELAQHVIDPKDRASFEAITVEVQTSVLLLPPRSFALARSFEYFRLPTFVTGLVIGKSTYARNGGAIYVTPLEAGWDGEVVIEITNHTPCQLAIYAGEGIGQVLFFAGDPPAVAYCDRESRYQGQRGITLGEV